MWASTGNLDFLVELLHLRTFSTQNSNSSSQDMYQPEVDFRILEMAKFGQLLAQKRQNWGKFFYLQTPKKGVYWPFLALLLGAPTQALKILTVWGCLEKVYQVSRPRKANQPLFWAFSVKRMILYRFGSPKGRIANKNEVKSTYKCGTLHCWK